MQIGDNIIITHVRSDFIVKWKSGMIGTIIEIKDTKLVINFREFEGEYQFNINPALNYVKYKILYRNKNLKYLLEHL